MFVKRTIVRRLAWAYGSAMFFILLMIGIIIYQSLSYSLISEVKNTLLTSAQVITVLTKQQPLNIPALRQEIETEPLAMFSKKSRQYSRLTDQDGQLIMQTPGIHQLASEAQLSDILTAYRAEPQAHKFTKIRSAAAHNPITSLVFTRQITQADGRNYYLQISINLHHQLELLEHYRQMIMWIMGLGILIAVLISILLAKSIARPIKYITNKLADINLNDLDQRLTEDQHADELLNLTKAYNRMCARLEKSFTKLQQFSADLAHELRTPVNNLIGQTEVALSSPRSSEAYQELLISNLEEFQRLSLIIKQLLFLAQTENPQNNVQLKEQELQPIINEVCDYYSALAESKNAELIFIDQVQQPIYLALEPALFRQVLNNLLGNALNYGKSQGNTITIELAIDPQIQQLMLTIRDQGIGIAEVDLPKLFDRFYRADKARDQYQGGSGLGLALVKKIMALHHAKIHITSELGKGTGVQLIFPNYTF